MIELRQHRKDMDFTPYDYVFEDVKKFDPQYVNRAYLVSKTIPSRPHLVAKATTNWDVYLDLLKEFPVPMDDKAMRELYYRAGPKEESLRAALNELMDYPIITMREINKHFAPVTRVYANQVVRAFLLGSYKKAWAMLSMLERELGSTIAFYAMRKYIRRVFAEKCMDLQNESIKDSIVEKVDGYTIILLYWLFETAVRPEQLYPILHMFERRQTPC